MYDLLITGHPRSGTGYMAALCQACGYDVGHERMGADGISSWLMAPPAHRVCYHAQIGRRGRLALGPYHRAIHVLRNDVPACVASIAYTEQASLVWRARWVPIDLSANPITQAVQSLLGWTRLIEAELPNAEPVRLSEAAERVPAMLGVSPPVQLPPCNTRPHSPLTWADLRQAVPRGDYHALCRHADRYGLDD